MEITKTRISGTREQAVLGGIQRKDGGVSCDVETYLQNGTTGVALSLSLTWISSHLPYKSRLSVHTPIHGAELIKLVCKSIFKDALTLGSEV